jgi:hypothetical protein
MVSIKRSDFFHDIFAAGFRALGPLRNEFCSAGCLRDVRRARRHLYLHVEVVEYVARPLGRDVRANGGRKAVECRG